MTSFKVILCLAVFILLGIAAVEHQPNNKFKNLQVLPKDITEDSLDKIMDRFTVDLGVNCNYCHTQDKKADSIIFASDNKPEKEIARKMMLMTMDINKNYFQFNEETTAVQVQAVTCYTCHKGTQIPEREKKVIKNSAFSILHN